jgi:hypothetical protein
LLRRWRAHRSVGEAARELAQDFSRYTNWENGVQRPGLWWAGEIERITGGDVPMASWLEEDPGVLYAEAKARAS